MPRAVHKSYQTAIKNIFRKLSIAGSLIGGIAETQVSYHFCQQLP